MAVMRFAAASKYLGPEHAQPCSLRHFLRNGVSGVTVFLLHTVAQTISNSMKQPDRRERNARWHARKLLRAVACKSDGVQTADWSGPSNPVEPEFRCCHAPCRAQQDLLSQEFESLR